MSTIAQDAPHVEVIAVDSTAQDASLLENVDPESAVESAVAENLEPIFTDVTNSENTSMQRELNAEIMEPIFTDVTNGANTVGMKREFNETTSDDFTPPTSIKKRKMNVRRKEEGLLESVCSWIVEHQTGLAINLLTLLLLTHMCFPRVRTQTRKFFSLSYYNSESGNYAVGPNDLYLVSYWVVIITGLRAAVMDYIILPFAKKGGIKSKRNLARFCEQSWLVMYISVFWSIGVYLLVNSDYMFDLRNMWTNFPMRESPGLLKWYTLVQFAFWVQQILVLFIEKPRKDHWQMFAHHIVTCALISCSYSYHQIRVSHFIMVTMDSVDLFFPTAKCLKYLGYTTACDIMFGLFMMVWVVTRHFLFMTLVWSVYAHSHTASPPGCYIGKMGSITGPFPTPDKYSHLAGPFTNSEGIICWTDTIRLSFVAALLFLQVLTLIWFSMICKVAAKVLRGGTADDTRSDDEDEDETLEEHEELEELQPFEEEVGVESLNLGCRTTVRATGNRKRKIVKSSGSASGVSIPDRKQLLGRIGCDKEA